MKPFLVFSVYNFYYTNDDLVKSLVFKVKTLIDTSAYRNPEKERTLPLCIYAMFRFYYFRKRHLDSV